MRKEEATTRFLVTCMLEKGGIRTNYLDPPAVYEYATGGDVLSESQGLVMRCAVALGDKALFEESYGYLRDRLLMDDGLISYRYSEEYGLYPVNAVDDDLRVIRALLEAADRFGRQDYRLHALWLADRLYDFCAPRGRLRDFYHSGDGAAADTLTLCNADFGTLSLLGEYDDRWRRVLRAALRVVRSGYLGDAFPLYCASYSYSQVGISRRDIDGVQALLTALHLAEIGCCPPETAEFIRERVTEGVLWGCYSVDGRPKSEVQSTALYALAAQLGAELGDEQLRRAALARMQDFRVEDPSSPLYGAYADAVTRQVCSFDNLCALQAHLA